MPTSVGPNTFGEENLVFGYDLGDVANSYLGEPTVNYIAGDTSLEANIDCSSTNATDILPDGSIGTVRRITVTANTYNGIIRASLVHTLPSSGVPQAGVSYTISCWIRNSSGVAVAAGWEPEVGPPDSYLRPNIESGFNGNYNSNSQPNTLSSNWTRVSYTYSYNSTQTSQIVPFIYFGHPVGGSGAGVGATIDFYQIQLEIKSHATPYVNGTRSVTQGLKDLTGRSTIDLTNVSFDSNAQMNFDGTNDSLVVSNNAVLKNNNSSIEFLIKYLNTPNGDIIQFGVGSGTYAQYYYRAYSGYSYWNWYPVGTGYGEIAIPNAALPLNKYHHIVMTGDDQGYVQFYINGVLQTGATRTANSQPANWTPADLTVGGFSWDGYSSSVIPYVKVYSRILTASEIRSNFNAIKSRFGI